MIATGLFKNWALNQASRSYVDICQRTHGRVYQQLWDWGSRHVNPISGKKQNPKNARHSVAQRVFLHNTKYSNAHATVPRRERTQKFEADRGEERQKGKGKGTSGNGKGKHQQGRHKDKGKGKR